MYAKIFEQIYDSSIADNWRTRVVFQDLLVLADKDGVVNRTHEAIAQRTRMPLKMIRDAIAELEAPDPRSQSPLCEGRRLVRLDAHRDWGWQIVNFMEYHAMKDQSDRKTYMRNYMRDNYVPKSVQNLKPTLTNLNTDANVLTQDMSGSGSALVQLKGSELVTQAEAIYIIYPRKVGRPKAIASICKSIKAHGFDKVLVATQDFAKAWHGAPAGEMQFCPHPTTWYNQERFNDEPSTWTRTNTGNSKPNPRNNNSNAGHHTDYSKVGKTHSVGVPNAGTPA